MPPPAQPPAFVTVEGVSRPMIVAVPPDYDPDEAHPLVVAFHGRTTPAERARRYFDLEQQADDAIIVYPSGTRTPEGHYTWWEPGQPADSLRDFALFDEIVDVIGRTYCLREDAIFVVGHSLGATFANALACARGDVIRGVAAVAGGTVARAECEGDVAALLLHHPDDELVPLAEAERALAMYLKQNEAAAETEPVALDAFACRRYGTDEAPVLWCPHTDALARGGRYYPHKWPDDAGDAIIDFFAGLD